MNRPPAKVNKQVTTTRMKRGVLKKGTGSITCTLKLRNFCLFSGPICTLKPERKWKEKIKQDNKTNK